MNGQQFHPLHGRARWGWSVAVVAVATLGCASSQKAFSYSPEQLVTAARARVPAEFHGELVAPFEISPRLASSARELVSGQRSDYDRARALLRAMTDEKVFGLEYEPVATAPAETTTARGYGNCLSLTSVFVGLARAVGLTAYYIDASDRVNDLRREEALIVDSGHIAAVVRTEKGYSLVDFDGELAEFRTFRIIDDLEALAHFYNNRGYELIHLAQREGAEIPWEEVRRSFELATRVQPGFARAHNNLGVVYSRLGNRSAAAGQYQAAIDADKDFAAPHHNLGNLRLAAGDVAGALVSYGQAAARQPSNPYLHYHRGLALYRRGDLPGAAAAFQRAISLKRDYIEPRNLLAQIYQQQGRVEEAEKIRRTVRLLIARQQRPGES